MQNAESPLLTLSYYLYRTLDRLKFFVRGAKCVSTILPNVGRNAVAVAGQPPFGFGFGFVFGFRYSGDSPRLRRSCTMHRGDASQTAMHVPFSPHDAPISKPFFKKKNSR